MRKLLFFTAVCALLLQAKPGGTADKLFDGAEKAKPKSVKELVAEHAAAPPALSAAEELDDRYWATFKAADAAARTRIATVGMSIEEIGDGTVSGVAGPAILQQLAREGFVEVKKVSLRRIRPEDFPDQDGAYNNYGEMQSKLTELAGTHPDLVSVFSIGKSVQGRAITAVRFHKKGAGEKPGIVFFGAHHAREHLSTEVPLLLAQWLADNRGRADVAGLLDSRDIYFVPMVNPDGVEYDIATSRYRWQRKNMRRNDNGTVGVDLNRNFDFRWGGAGASGNPGADTYYGTAPFSEPETQAVRDFLLAHRNISIVVSYHTFSELILYPWGGVDGPIEDGRALAAFRAMAGKMAEWTGYRPMQSSDLYVATGDTCDWTWAKLNMFCFTFELTPKSSWEGGFYPGAGAIGTTFKKNIDPALYMIDLADNPYRAGESQ
ncbi:MAG: M14 family metallopeptidase [Elusimicrobiota bacterium]